MTARTDAALALAHAEARVIEARNALRDAVKAEIAAMPEVGDGEGFHAKVAALAVVLGVPTTIGDDNGPYAEWDVASVAQLFLAESYDGFRVDAWATKDARGEWRLSDHTLDAALRLALGWLADRDVFVEVRS